MAPEMCPKSFGSFEKRVPGTEDTTVKWTIDFRFAEALELLEGGLAFVNKVCEDLASYRWPGSSVEIDESKPEKLLVRLF